MAEPRKYNTTFGKCVILQSKEKILISRKYAKHIENLCRHLRDYSHSNPKTNSNKKIFQNICLHIKRET